MEFDELISLGGSCAPAYQSRHNFEGLPVMPFDWWTLRLPDVSTVLREGLTHTFDDDTVHLGEYINRPALFSRHAIHVHDLPDDVMKDKSDRWREYLPTLRGRYQFLERQLHERAASGKVLFIRLCIGEDEYLRPTFLDLTQSLIKAIHEVFPRAHSKLLMLGYNCEELQQIPDVLVDEVTAYTQDNMGCKQGWKEMFQRNGIVRSR